MPVNKHALIRYHALDKCFGNRFRRYYIDDLIDATAFCVPASKSLGNKRNDIRLEDIEHILDLYLRFEENEHSHIFPNRFFGSCQVTVEQPLRDADGNVQKTKRGLTPDPAKRDTENIPLDVDVYEYFQREVLPHIDPESWMDISKTRMNYEINFTRYFYKYQAPEPSDAIAQRICQSEEVVRQLMSRLFGTQR
jgi:type I restriction enzyme M protein